MPGLLARFLSALAPALLLITLTTASLSAQDWTRFRGPNGSGVVESLSFPATWTDTDYAWQTELPGIGHSSPVSWQTTTYLLSADPETAKRFVVAIDLTDGSLAWQRDFSSQVHSVHSYNSFASSTPAVDEHGLYVAWSTPESTTLMALTHEGKERWSRDLGRWVSQHGFGTSPMVYKDRVILFNSQQKDQLRPGQVAGQSRMMAFDAISGETLWETDTITTRSCYGVPCVRTNSKGKDELVACNTGNGIFAIDPMSGEINWEISVFNQRCVASPIIAGDLVLGSCGSGGGGNVLVAVNPEPTPKEVFRVTSQANYVPTPIAHEGLVFLLSDKTGVVSCVEVETGKTLWKERVGKGFSGSPIIAGERLYLVDDNGVMHVLAAAKEFKSLASIDLGEPSRATPSVAHGLMLIRTESKLRALPAE